MNLIKFLFMGTILAVLLGEFGRFPFGGSSTSITLMDILLSTTLVLFIVWKVTTKEKILIPKNFKWVVYFWIIGIVSLGLSLIYFPIQEIVKGGSYLVRYILYSSSMVVVFNLLKQNIISRDSLIKLLISVGIILTGLGFMQLVFYPNFEDPPFFLTDFGFDPHRGRLTSTFLDPNFLGVFLVMTFGLVTYLLLKRPNRNNWVSLLLLVSGVLFTMSRSAYLSLFIVLAVIFWQARSLLVSKSSIRGLLLVALISVLVLMTVPQFRTRLKGAFLIDSSASLRFQSWWKGMEIVKFNPLLGVGFNNIRIAQQELYLTGVGSPEGGHAGSGIDSSLLFVLSTTGVLGIIVYLIFWGKMFRDLWKSNSISATVFLAIIISLIFSSQFINSLFFPAIMLWYFTILGLINESSGKL
ncbi:hypothetical protein A2780_00355 [Candidatus Daviesbacteria bacterium RIFCSPHIGHO2_01_FULL_41_45]|nr:MAG: hypothetical protein A2780_00355 [Candidatus Daviesbacteria bacterium RIFCSPHIGHO2_01_FULL_41_45]